MTHYLKIVWITWLTLSLAAMGVVELPGTLHAEEPDGGGWVSKIISLQGEVLVRRDGQTRWQPVELNDTFYAGDQIRVDSNGRAGIVLSNDAVMRLDQNTTLIFTEIVQQKTFILRLLEGAANFFSHRPRSLKILTPFVNGVVEGTEFFVQVDGNQTRIDLFEGRILADNEHGILDLSKGEGVVAPAGKAPQRYILVRPRESVQWAMYYPPILTLGPGVASIDINQVLALFNKGQTAQALARLESIKTENRDATFFICRAAVLLHVGRIALARSDIQQALALDPQNSDALALKAVIAVVQNRTTEAVDTARKAVQRNPHSVSARIALSYALQAQFKLPEALAAAREAVSQRPGSGLAWARLADLQLSVGALDKGVSAAQKAVDLAPHTAHAHTVLGFAYLTRIDTEKARDAFDQAIVLDSAAPLSRLGLGLADIRDGDLEKGRSEIEIAAGLDPGNSLIRSYLGKAYFDEKRDPLDGQQFEIAKTLDPNDPTPWFYDAIRKQSLNRPVEALQDLQKSIELNDNRAVYRSRLQLDQDLAARSASLGQIYNDLGFQELALRQGWTALNADPTNYSAHRLLSDSYSARSRHEIARVSELLQSQLLQPLTISPVQPQLAESNLLIPEGSGLGSVSFNEYNQLFVRNRFTAQVSGIAGNNRTLGDEIAVSGIYDQLSGSVGQFHYETEGFRENNDLDQNIYNSYIQAALTPELSIQVEYRNRNIKHGDLEFNWDLEDVDHNFKRRVDSDTIRVGAHLKPANHSDIIASAIYQDREENDSSVILGEFYGIPYAVPWETELDSEGFIGEIQYIYNNPVYDILFGGGHYHIDSTNDTTLSLPEAFKDFDTTHSNGYVYSYFNLPNPLMWTVGLSFDTLDDPWIGKIDQFNPKIGLNWSIRDDSILRLAAFRVLKRTLIANKTIEPTHVAGFNQFYDDFNGSDATVFGAAFDHRFFNHIYIGIDYLLRRIEKLTSLIDSDPIEEDWDEDTIQAYVYWAISPRLSLSTEYTYEWFDREGNPDESAPFEMKTHLMPFKLGYYLPSGVFSRLRATYVKQKVWLADQPNEPVNDDFTIFDFITGYRFPNRLGILSFEIRNLFDKHFSFMSIDTRTSQFVNNAPFIPERNFLCRLTLTF